MALSVKEYVKQGPATSREIQAATGLSQSSVARKLRDMGDRVVQLQEGRSIRYAATCNAFGSGDKLPLARVDGHGDVSVIAHIRPLTHGGFWVEPVKAVPPVLLGDSGNGLYDGLPYFLYDLRPQGFLGRQIARNIASQSEDFPSDPRLWTNDHIGRYLLSNGEDLPGDLLFGEQALLRVRRSPAPVSPKDYSRLADRVMKGEAPGSSAGGEQPKFTAFNGDTRSHVIVKFSPRGENEIAQRWNDILITEYHAAEMIARPIFPAAKTGLFETNGRLFLETQRFDRIKEFGRSSMVSLQSIDKEFVGRGHNWVKVMGELSKNKMIREQDALSAESLWLFGRLINNTDMHLGNLSLSMENDLFRLLPVYDMCSMGFAPKTGGEIHPFAFRASEIPDTNLGGNQIEKITKCAHAFWENVANDDRISSQFKSFLRQGNPVEPLLRNLTGNP